MQINIVQEKFSIRDRYQVFINEKLRYSASSELLSFFPVIHLFGNEGGRPRLTINKLWSWLGAKYNITLYDNSRLEFRTKTFWKYHYRCQYGPDLFDIYGHRGRKYSVYKHDKQVAWWDKNSVALLKGDHYKVIADDDSDLELIMAFCLVIDNYSYDHKQGNAVTLDFGNIGLQAKKFNPEWKPKEAV